MTPDPPLSTETRSGISSCLFAFLSLPPPFLSERVLAIVAAPPLFSIAGTSAALLEKTNLLPLPTPPPLHSRVRARRSPCFPGRIIDYPTRLDELGGSHVLMGLAALVMCAAEVPFFYLSGPLIEKIGSRNVVALAQLGYIVRLTYYSVRVAVLSRNLGSLAPSSDRCRLKGKGAGQGSSGYRS